MRDKPDGDESATHQASHKPADRPQTDKTMAFGNCDTSLFSKRNNIPCQRSEVCRLDSFQKTATRFVTSPFFSRTFLNFLLRTTSEAFTTLDIRSVAKSTKPTHSFAYSAIERRIPHRLPTSYTQKCEKPVFVQHSSIATLNIKVPFFAIILISCKMLFEECLQTWQTNICHACASCRLSFPWISSFYVK